MAMSVAAAEPERAVTMPAFDGPDRVELGRLVRIMWRRRWAFLAAFLLVCVPLTAIILTLPRYYTAETTVMIDPRVEQVVDVKSVLSGLLGDPEAIASEIEVIRSRDLARQVVREFALTQKPEFNPSLSEGPSSGIASRLGGAWDHVAGWVLTRSPEIGRALGLDRSLLLLSEDEGEADSASSSALIESRTLDLFAKRLGVVGLNKSRVLAVSFTSRDPELAARIANRVAALYLGRQVELSRDATKEASDWLAERLAGLRLDVDRAEKALERFRVDSILSAGLSPDSLSRQSDAVNERLVEARAHASDLRARSRDAESQMRSRGSSAVLALLNSEVAIRLRGEEALLIQQAAQLGEQLGPQHPRMRELGDQRQAIAQQIDAEAQRQLGMLRSQLGGAEQQVAALEAENKRLAGEQSKLTGAEITLRSLERDAEANRTVLELFLQRYKETEQSAVDRPSAWIVSRADVPSRPTKPNRLLLLAGALALSGASAAGAAAFADRRRNSIIVSGDDLQNNIGVETHTAVPLVQRPEMRRAHAAEAGAYGELHPKSTFGSAIRGLAMELTVKLAQDGRSNVVAITSALPSEGKTTISTALAVTLARAERRVLLVDADLIRGRIHRVLNLPNDRGMSEHLEDPAGSVPLLRPFDDLPLHVATAGRIGLRGANALRVDRIADFVEAARARYDVVIIDTPPVLPVPYSRILAGHAGHTLLVVRWGGTDRRVVRRAAERLASAGAHLSMATLNRVDLDRQAEFDCTEALYVRDKAYRAYLQS